MKYLNIQIQILQYHLKKLELAEKGYKVKVWDGYRPHKVQFKFWDIVKDKFEHPEDYVADPKKGSRHNRGAAIDITLLDKDGKEIDMGTKFDDFSKKAHRDYKELSDEVQKNRKILEETMTKNGFVGLPTEWWHFDFQEALKKPQNYPILDVSFDELEKK